MIKTILYNDKTVSAKHISVILFVILNFSSYSQTINKNTLYGKWQMGTPEISAGYTFTYSFDTVQHFEFKNSENEGLNTIIGIYGKYEIKNSVLILYINSLREITGGYPRISETLGGSGWELDKGKIIKRNFIKIAKDSVSIGKCPSKDGARCITINAIKYYKVE